MVCLHLISLVCLKQPSTKARKARKGKKRKEKKRVRSALINSNLDFPDRRITINLAPADLPKSGGRFDLAIAIGILAASGLVPAEKLTQIEFLGELALSGEVRQVSAVLPGVMAANKHCWSIIIPETNSQEASLLRGANCHSCRHLLEVISHLQGKTAHNGVLFLDELPEFSPRVLEVLREPLESGTISISRVNYQVKLLARFQLIAAMNPCPCGFLNSNEKQCRCNPGKIKKYQSRISGPLLDRMDLHVQVSQLRKEEQEQLLASDSHISESSDSA
jgi:predicted ATPase with chaperone activity